MTLLAVSRAPCREFAAFKERLGWRFKWVSSAGSDFNYDFGVSFTKEQVASGDISYNFGTTPYAYEELHGISVFFKKAPATSSTPTRPILRVETSCSGRTTTST